MLHFTRLVTQIESMTSNLEKADELYQDEEFIAMRTSSSGMSPFV